jgi:hypothetical protein
MDNMNEDGLLLDAWIDAIPTDPYAQCPCGCGKKFKFVKDNPEAHELRFIENLRKQTRQPAAA